MFVSGQKRAARRNRTGASGSRWSARLYRLAWGLASLALGWCHGSCWAL